MNISIELASKDEKEILRNLTEKYEYEFTAYEDADVNKYGLYGYKFIDHYFTEEGWFAYFIKVNNVLAGFIMINNYHRYITKIESKYIIAELFIMYKYKKLGVGTYAVNYVLNKHKGKWQVGYNPKNEIGKIFWNKTINNFTKGKYEINKENVDQKYEDGTMAEVLIFET